MNNQISRNCFVSYYHAGDQRYLSKLRGLIYDMSVFDHSLKDDVGFYTDLTIYRIIRDKMRRCSVTIVLIGENTGSRKWIDWEIWASLRPYSHPTDSSKSFRSNGILAIFLPTKNHHIPKRLQDNIDSDYAVCMKWENLLDDFESKVNYAHWKRTYATDRIDNSRPKQLRNLTIR